LPGWVQHLAIRAFGLTISPVEGKRISLLTACGVVGLAALPISRLKGEGRTEGVSWLERPSPFLLRFLFASACWGAALGAFNPFSGVFFVRGWGVETARLGSFFSVAQLVQALALLFVPLILRWTRLIPGILVMQLTTAATLALLGIGRNLLQIQLIYCGFMAAQHMTEPAIQSLLMDRVKQKERSTATSMSYLVLSLAQAAAASMTGFAYVRFGYPIVLMVVAGGAAAAALIFRILCGPAHESVLEQKMMAN
jgi:predicted MFS family arabinose efflux permease